MFAKWCAGMLLGVFPWRVKALLSLTRSWFNLRPGFMSMLNNTTAPHTLSWLHGTSVCLFVCVCVSPQGWHETSCWVLWCAWWQMLNPPLFSTLFLLDVSAVDILAQATSLSIYTHTRTYGRCSVCAAISGCVYAQLDWGLGWANILTTYKPIVSALTAVFRFLLLFFLFLFRCLYCWVNWLQHIVKMIALISKHILKIEHIYESKHKYTVRF